MDQKTINELKATACKVRMGVIEGTHGAKAGHSGPAAALLKQFGLSAEHIVEVAKNFVGKG